MINDLYSEVETLEKIEKEKPKKVSKQKKVLIKINSHIKHELNKIKARIK